MFDVLFSMGALISCGIVWNIIRPSKLDPDAVRKTITDLVYYLLLPALVLAVLWKAPISHDSLRIASLAILGILVGLISGWIVGALILRHPKPVVATIMLAAAFPNATYLGLPVLESVFGEDGRFIAIQYDLFACTPVLLTIGIFIAQKMGTPIEGENAYFGLLKVPPFWAAFIALLLNYSGLPAPAWFDKTINLLGNGVAPLMLFALGLSLRWKMMNWHTLLNSLPIAFIQLGLVPLVVYFTGQSWTTDPKLLAAITLEAAMPSMVLGLLICDRYQLDTGLYATAVTVSTVLGIATLGLWLGHLI